MDLKTELDQKAARAAAYHDFIFPARDILSAVEHVQQQRAQGAPITLFLNADGDSVHVDIDGKRAFGTRSPGLQAATEGFLSALREEFLLQAADLNARAAMLERGEACATCHGRGFVRDGNGVTASECPTCNGTGRA